MHGINVSLFNMYVLTIYLIQTQTRGWGAQMSPNKCEQKPNEDMNQSLSHVYSVPTILDAWAQIAYQQIPAGQRL